MKLESISRIATASKMYPKRKSHSFPFEKSATNNRVYFLFYHNKLAPSETRQRKKTVYIIIIKTNSTVRSVVLGKHNIRIYWLKSRVHLLSSSGHYLYTHQVQVV